MTRIQKWLTTLVHPPMSVHIISGNAALRFQLLAVAGVFLLVLPIFICRASQSETTQPFDDMEARLNREITQGTAAKEWRARGLIE
jgi:hypothetical protein